MSNPMRATMNPNPNRVNRRLGVGAPRTSLSGLPVNMQDFLPDVIDHGDCNCGNCAAGRQMFNTTQIRAIQGSASAAAPRRIAQTVPSATANAPRRTKTLADQLETLKREGHEPALKCYLATLVGLGAQDNQCQKGPDHELLGKLGQLSHSNLDVTALLVGQVGAVRRVFRNESPDLNISFGRPEGTMTEEMWKSILDFCDKYHAQHMLFADELSRSLRSASTSANVTNTTAGASTEESAPAAPSSDFQN